jgi:hypothetical protein
MYPVKVTDAQVQSLIRELAVGAKLPSGATVRAALARRYQSRGGVARIYRLLAAERGPLQEPESGWGRVNAEVLRQENQTLRQHLQEARELETRHQDHWGREVARLREQIEGLMSRLDAAVAAGVNVDAVGDDAHTAEIKVGRLEVLVRAFGPGAGKGGSSR